MRKRLLALRALLAAPASADTLIVNANGIQVGADGKIEHFTGLLIGNDGKVVQLLARRRAVTSGDTSSTRMAGRCCPA